MKQIIKKTYSKPEFVQIQPGTPEYERILAVLNENLTNEEKMEIADREEQE